MILMLHITVGVLSLILGLAAVIQVERRWLTAQIVSFVATILSGAMLLIQQPNTLAHLCVSGVVFSTLSIALMLLARRRLTYTASV